MATLENKADGVANSPAALRKGGVNPQVKATPDNYTTIGTLVDDYAKPDNKSSSSKPTATKVSLAF